MFSFFRRRKVDPKARLARVLGRCQLPSFQGVVLQTLEKTRDPDATAAEISHVLESDPGLTVRVLKTVNSAAYSLHRQVDDLQQAIALLGMSNLESLVLSIAVRDSLPRQAVAGFDPARFWSLAARRASVSRALSGLLHPRRSAESFTAGLLQDLAVPLLATSDPDNYGPILDASRTRGTPLHELEQAAFGWDHAEVGTWVCSEWGLPETLAASIGGHHGHVEEGLEALPAVSLAALLREDSDGELVEAGSRHGIDPDTMTALLRSSTEGTEQLVDA